VSTVNELTKVEVYTTSIGVGDDFNEDLLAQLADIGFVELVGCLSY
jgi:hypothetical protein